MQVKTIKYTATRQKKGNSGSKYSRQKTNYSKTKSSKFLTKFVEAVY